MSVIKDLFKSKKFVVMLVGVIGYALSRFGFDVSADKIEPIVQMVSVYLVGQGAADLGKGLAAKKAGPAAVYADTETPKA